MSDGLPEYVEYGALGSVPGPLLCAGTTLTGFWLEGDADRIGALLDRVFEAPTDGAVKARTLWPFGRFVMITFGVIDNITVQTPPFDRMGTVTEPQVALWIPALVSHPGGTTLGVFVPFIWLDNPISLASGREVFGWSKTWGVPVLPADGGEEVYGLDAFGMNYDRGEQPRLHRIITVERRDGDGDHEEGEEIDNLRGLAGHVARQLIGGRDVAAPAESIAARAVPDRGLLDRFELGPTEVFLKQIRDTADGKRAALQQVTQTHMPIRRFKARPLFGRYDVTVDHLDASPVDDALGLATGRAYAPFRIEMDFVVEAGEVLWPT